MKIFQIRKCAIIFALINVSCTNLFAHPDGEPLTVYGGAILFEDPELDSLVMIEFPFVLSRHEFEFFQADTTDTNWYARVYAQVRLLSYNRPVVLLSGGVGLTPMIAMLNDLTERAPGRTIWFIHGTRNGGEHAMGAHVRCLVRENDNVHAYICYSEPHAVDIKGKDYDRHGWVEIDLLKKILPFDDFDFYICGPPPFMKSIYSGLCLLNVSEARIHYEFFGPASILRDTSTNKSQARKNQETVDANVTFARSGVTAKWDTSSSSLLDFAEAQGLQLPFSCRSGICQTCACPLVEGEVEYIEEPLDEPEQGQVLICSSKPLSNIVLDV